MESKGKPLFANILKSLYRKAKSSVETVPGTFKEISKILEQHTKISYISIH